MSIMFQLLSFTSILTCSFFLLVLVAYWKRNKARGTILKSPPGPWKLPLIGNLHQLITSGSLPHYSLRDLAKKHGPVMQLQLGEVSAVIISSPKAAREVLKTHELCFAQRPDFFVGEFLSYAYSGILGSPYGDCWRQMRKICVLELLSAQRVHSFRSVREEEVWNLIETLSLSNGLSINLSKHLFDLTNTVTSRAAFGEKCKAQDEFISLVKEIMVLATGFIVPDLSRVTSNLGSQPSTSKLSLRNDLIDSCNRGETTATTLEWAMSELLRNPKVMEKAQAEVCKVIEGKRKIEYIDTQKLDYVKLVVKETLRLHPPGTLIPRECRERCEINGYDIPTKTKVIVNLWAIGRDPDYWVNVDCFQPERFHGSSVDFKGNDFEFLPFGAGRRMCPGITFASAIIELALAQLLYHFDWKLPNEVKPEELDMTENFGSTCRRKNDLYLNVTPRFPFLMETCGQ
uniref:Cytochrome P450 n=1 Tax=Quercus lobata TaxID=97700 RepID=A0A7N2L3J2_QUELO